MRTATTGRIRLYFNAGHGRVVVSETLGVMRKFKPDPEGDDNPQEKDGYEFCEFGLSHFEFR